jgi:hypothetical protein
MTMAEAARVQPQQQGGWLDLPEDIMYDILLRLPPKFVIHCRVVCRSCVTLSVLPRVTTHQSILEHHVIVVLHILKGVKPFE